MQVLSFGLAKSIVYAGQQTDMCAQVLCVTPFARMEQFWLRGVIPRQARLVSCETLDGLHGFLYTSSREPWYQAVITSCSSVQGFCQMHCCSTLLPEASVCHTPECR